VRVSWVTRFYHDRGPNGAPRPRLRRGRTPGGCVTLLTVLSPRALLSLTALLALGAGCAAAPSPLSPPRAPAPAPLPATAVAAAPEPAAPARPFHLPCADDDLIGCTNGCSDKFTEDCVTLGSMYLTGERVSLDQTRAIDLFRAACDEGSARGCMRLGDAYHRGLLRGDAEEVDCYRRACDAGANLGCVSAARAYLAGRGAPVDPVFAATLLGRVCDRGNATACFELARLHSAGVGVKRDPTKSFELFRKACKLGLDEGCLAASRTEETLPPRD
jgi:hypothetical protein